MNNPNLKQLRAAVSEHTQPSNILALAILVADVCVYSAAIAGVIFMDNLVLRLLCGIIAGFRIGTIFLIAHDAAHTSYTSSKILNRILGRLCFMPSLHNYSLWMIAHNRMHHRLTNIKGKNSWSPLAKDEYDSLPPWRRALERMYRSPAGICFNYLIERWWKNKFFPFQRICGANRAIYWFDFLLVLIYFAAFLMLLAYAGSTLVHTSPVELIVLGFGVPYLVANFVIGFTIYQHHTHETIPWYEAEDKRRMLVAQADVTMHVVYPHWYNIITFNAMEHTAHHIDPRIPLYNLAKAQKVITRLLASKMVMIPFTMKGFLRTMERCKLYDYKNHRWLDFNGCVTAEPDIHIYDLECKRAA